MAAPLLDIRNLRTLVSGEGGEFFAVHDVSLELSAGASLAVVGESGCGKTLLGLSLMRLLPEAARAAGGEVRLEGVDLLGLSERQMQRVRGNRMAMVFQEPAAALNPVLSIGTQLAEAIRLHHGGGAAEARRCAVEALRGVGLPDPEQRVDSYPHQLSGGMRQRALIAMALACDPALLIADEPTTALDATVQAQILELLRSLRAGRRMALLLISHDLGVVSALCDEIAVMYAGRVVERAPAAAVFEAPAHPYTRGLLRAGSPAEVVAGARRARLSTIPGGASC
jgi:ABC-type dipeptide/oligopeptide/nickel transport system ATPase component